MSQIDATKRANVRVRRNDKRINSLRDAHSFVNVYRVANLSQIKTKRNDVIKMQMIEFDNAFDVIEMFESRFAFANVEMSQIIRDDIETQLSQIDLLRFEFVLMHANIETCLHMQIALNYAHTICDETNVVVNVIAHDIITNRTMFEIVNVDLMLTIEKIVINNDLKLQNV